MANAYSSSNRGQVEAAAPSFNANALIGAGIVVAGLYFSREVLVPFVVAALLSFVLAIPVRALQDWGFGRTFPVAIVVLVAFLILMALGAVLVSQVSDLVSELPRYHSTIRDKLTALKGAASGHGPLERLAGMLQGLSEDLTGRPTSPPIEAENPNAQRPVPVEIATVRTSPLTTISSFIAPLLHPLATLGLIIVFTIFILLQRGDLRNRAIRLAGSHDLQRTTAAMNDAAARLSRLFLAQVLLNAGFGVVVGLGLWLIGVPSPILWGMMAAISRFIPYVGVVLAAGGPLILAAAVDPNWTMLVYTGVFFAITEALVGQAIEPLVFGHSTGLSPVAVILSVTFWTWLWGPIGLLLATPLTVCLVVLGRHVDRLEFLDVMLGDRPPLTAAESFYQRVLAGDAGETIEQAELFLRDHALVTYYDEVAVKGLALAQVDLAKGNLDSVHLSQIQEAITLLIDDMSDQDAEASASDAKKVETKRAAGDADLDRSLELADEVSQSLPLLQQSGIPEEWRRDGTVLCLAGRNELDGAGALMLAQVLSKHGLGVATEGAGALASAGAGRLSNEATKIVCLSYLDTSSPVHVRYAVRRIRRRLPNAKVLVGSWGIESGAARSLCELARADGCASRLVEAAQFCLEAALGVAPATAAAAAGTPRANSAAGDASARSRSTSAPPQATAA